MVPLAPMAPMAPTSRHLQADTFVKELAAVVPELGTIQNRSNVQVTVYPGGTDTERVHSGCRADTERIQTGYGEDTKGYRSETDWVLSGY